MGGHYRVPNYTKVSAAEARQLIENARPLVLDVRTKSGLYTWFRMNTQIRKSSYPV